MAIYVVFQCCKCNTKKRLHLYSCSKNEFDKNYNLCEHFTVTYSYICKWGFFTLGWNIKILVQIKCKNCNNKYSFGENTFNSHYYTHYNYHICCYNVFMFNVTGNNYATDGKGLLLQDEQRQLENKFKKEIEVKRKNEEKRKRNLEEKIKIQNLTKRQRKEKKELDKLYNLNINYIELELNKLFLSMDNKLNNELSFDLEENMNKKINYSFSKFEFN